MTNGIQGDYIISKIIKEVISLLKFMMVKCTLVAQMRDLHLTM